MILNCIVAVLECYSCNITNSLEECSSQTVYCESDNEVRHTRVHFDIVICDGFEKHKTKALLRFINNEISLMSCRFAMQNGQAHYTRKDVKRYIPWEAILRTLLHVMMKGVNIGANKSCVITRITVVSR